MRKVCELGSQSSESVGMGEGEDEGEMGDIDPVDCGEAGAAEASEFFRFLAL